MLQFTKTIGEGVLRDSRGVLAASAGGLLAVTDVGECRIQVFAIETDRLVYELGRCGEGPEEFRLVRAMAFVEDTLYAYDTGRQSLVTISPDGRIVRRIVPRTGQTPREDFGEILPFRQGFLAFPGSDIGRTPYLAGTMRLDDGSLSSRFGTPPAAVVAQQEALMRGHFMACSVIWPEGRIVILANTWLPQLIAYRDDGTPYWQHVNADFPLKPVEHDQNTVPSAVTRPPVCGQDGVMARLVTVPTWSPRNTAMDRGVIAIYDHTGRQTFSATIDSTGEALFGRAATWGAYWLFNDLSADRPAIMTYTLRPRRPGDTTAVVNRTLP